MIPVFECLQDVCIAGVAWRPELLAAFLAWWMPLNLLSYYATLALVPLLIPGSAWKSNALTLKQFALMTMGFWPVVFGRTAYVLVMVALEARDRKKRKSNQQVYFTDEDV